MVFFFDWLISLSIIISRSNHAVTKANNLRLEALKIIPNGEGKEEGSRRGYRADKW